MRDLVQYSGAHKTRKLNPHGIGHELNIELNSVGQKNGKINFKSCTIINRSQKSKSK